MERPTNVLAKILGGILPSVDDESIFSAPLARLCKFCWRNVPTQRPSAKQIARALQFLLSSDACISQPNGSSFKTFDGLRFLDLYIASNEEPLYSVINFISAFSGRRLTGKFPTRKWAKGESSLEVTSWVKDTVKYV